MQTVITPQPAVSPRPAIERRVDLYADIHKALRHAMSTTMVGIGRTDHDDVGDVTRMTESVRTMLALCLSHVKKENAFVHPAMEARAPGSSTRLGGEHEHHLQAIADLEEDVHVVEATGGAVREAAIARLYQHVALFVADHVEHMQLEETEHNAVLWEHYEDGELLAIHGAILQSLSPAEMRSTMPWLLQAVTPAARAAMFAGMRAAMPAPAFEAALDVARGCLDTASWDKLARSLGVAQAPGLVDCR